LFRRSDYSDRPPNAYLETSLFEVIGIFVKDTILSLDVAYNVKPGADNSWIAA
jgi:hypothetical protein